MTPLAFVVLAVAVGLAVVAAGVASVGRERGRRQRLELERRVRSERLIMERVDWVAGTARVMPQPGEMPAAQEPVAVFAAAATRPVVASTDQAIPAAGSTDLSPRRRLWRDASAVLFVGVLGALAFSLVGTPGGAPQGGVLAVTSAPDSDAGSG
jgi:multisubunit Na+/H+ antiporter MnhB subunit